MAHPFNPPRLREALLSHSRQQGVSLAVVLVSMVIMAFAAVGLTRMVDAGTLIIGNVAFKQNTTSAADRGMEDAMTFLRNNPALLNADSPGNGYFAFVRPTLDPTWSGGGNRVLPAWNGLNCAGAVGVVTECLRTAGEDGAQGDGNQVRYLIIRLCSAAGDATQWGLQCMRPLGPGQDYTRPAGALDNANVWTGAGTAPAPVYRVIVRSTGPRNTVSYTDTYVQSF